MHLVEQDKSGTTVGPISIFQTVSCGSGGILEPNRSDCLKVYAVQGHLQVDQTMLYQEMHPSFFFNLRPNLGQSKQPSNLFTQAT